MSGLRHNAARIALAAVIAAIVVAFYVLGLDHYLSLGYLHGREHWLRSLYGLHPVAVAFLYLALYVAITGLSLPLASAITLLGGMILGLLWGTLIVTLAAGFGATLSFLAARYLFRDTVQRRFAPQLAAINRGVDRDGAYYLFMLRLIPLFPFFVINLVLGLTPMRTRTYALVSLVGMIPGNLLYVNAGVQLGRVQELRDFLSPAVIASLVAVGALPLALKKSIDWWRRRQASTI